MLIKNNVKKLNFGQLFTILPLINFNSLSIISICASCVNIANVFLSSIAKKNIEILQLLADFQTSMVSYLRFSWIRNSSDHRSCRIYRFCNFTELKLQIDPKNKHNTVASI